MNSVVEIFRHTFPKGLRFDKASEILFAQCYTISRRHRHKKYIPVSEIQDVLDGYTPLPGAPFLQLPIVRHLLQIRLINAARQYSGRKGWLYNKAVEAEHTKAQQWLDGYSRNSGPRASRHAGWQGGVVERERYDRELLAQMHIATMYHRVWRYGAAGFVVLLLFIAALLNTDYFVYLYMRYWCQLDRGGILAWMAEVTQRHTVADMPSEYAHILPAPCEQYTTDSGEPSYRINMVELVSEDRCVTVIALPCPQMGERDFFEQLGQIAVACDCVLLEGISFHDLDHATPAVWFPMKQDPFPALGVHHRFYDVLRGNGVPPKLYPAGAQVSWHTRMRYLIAPYEVYCVYQPTMLSASKAEARVCWGRLRSVIEEHSAAASEEKEKKRGGGDAKPHYIIGLPWSIHHIANLEASLVKLGFSVKNVFPLHWITEQHIGRHFCDYYHVTA